MDKLYTEILNLAADAARKAGTFIREARKTGLQVNAKSRLDFVSDKDLMSENMIREMILEHYPDHLFFGEESVSGCSAEEEKEQIESFRDEDFIWVVDPIDGTVNYIRDYPQYAVSIGVVHHREIIAGAIYDPFRDELFTACMDGGAFLNGERIRVSAAKDAGDAIINTSMPASSMQTRSDMVSRIPKVSGAFQSMRMWNCAAVSLASVACGRTDANYEAGIHMWDMAAGILLVREVGGKVTRLDGSPCTLIQTDILATNGCVHAAAVRALNTEKG